MDKKNYISPEIEKILLSAEDVVTASDGITTGGKEQGGNEYGEYYPIF